ncbi:polysaccharide biosynthesis protein [Anaerolineales bacterium HSG6]|nr:polysaccharide biosynthesis protein [Anaerolineales bacterium HSG6]MDM8532000.1 polysaccharide biosynthesis protein [Anaerolineales bacterium HSG25]
MDNFAFIIHPVNPKRDVQRKHPILGKLLTESAIDVLSRYYPPIKISHITGITSQLTSKEIEGWFIACPLTPKQMVSLPSEIVYKKIIQSGKLAQKLGAKVLGLGGFTSVVGDAGITVAKHLDIPVTTGDSYTIAVAVDATYKAALQMNINPNQATAAIVGATGSIGKVCAQLLAPKVKNIILIGRDIAKLQSVQQIVLSQGNTNSTISTNFETLQECDMVLTVTNAIDSIIEPNHLKAGAVVCDVARPRDVSKQVMEKRDDVLVIEGGVVRVPGNVNFNFDFGLPSNMAFACMAETMTIALEGHYKNYTLGKNIALDQVEKMFNISTQHGFQVSGFRGAELAITDEQIKQIKHNARQKQAQLYWANS